MKEDKYKDLRMIETHSGKIVIGVYDEVDDILIRPGVVKLMPTGGDKFNVALFPLGYPVIKEFGMTELKVKESLSFEYLIETVDPILLDKYLNLTS